MLNDERSFFSKGRNKILMLLINHVINLSRVFAMIQEQCTTSDSVLKHEHV